MKTLLLLRHAKSSWDDPEMPDHDRPLQKRGKRDAPRVGRLLAELGSAPDLIVSSSAKRARKTAAKVAKACKYEGVIEVTGDLYESPPERYLEVIRQVPDQVHRLLVVGHNPTLEELLQMLVGRYETLNTAALAEIELPLDSWQQLTASTPATLVHLWRPREIEE